MIGIFQNAAPVTAINTNVKQQGIKMKKLKKLVITDLQPEYFQVFDAIAEVLQLTRSQFLVSLMVQNGVIPGGLECIVPDLEYQAEWREQLIQRQFQWANSL